ncbi:MAG: hypothetical protein Q8Q01_00515 [archaeon]|nr:hypothetical protein [archaeon]
MSEDNHDFEQVGEEPTWYEVVGRMGGNIGSFIYQSFKKVVKPIGEFAVGWTSGGIIFPLLGPYAFRRDSYYDKFKEKIENQTADNDITLYKNEKIGEVTGLLSSVVGYVTLIYYCSKDTVDGKVDPDLTYVPLLPLATNALSFLYEIGRKSFQATKQELIAENKERVALKEPMNPINGLSYPTDYSLDEQLSITTNARPILERLREDHSLEGKVGYSHKQTESTTG